MRLTIIGASDEAIHTIECAKELGIETVALDGNPEAAGLEAADIPIVVDITDEKATIDIISELGTDWIQTVPIGRYLTTTGAVNDALGLPGITKDMAEICTDKYAFHKSLNNAGLRDCICRKVSAELTESEADSLLKNLSESSPSYPMILKPRYGSGSRGIMMAFSESELSEILADMEEVSEDYVLEECLEGEEYGIDAVVTGGEFHLILLRDKFNTPFPYRQAVGYISVLPSDPVYQTIRNYTKSVVDTLGLDECLMHADVLLTDRGPFAIEVSARPSGHNLHNLFTPLSTGVDMAAEYMKYRMGKTYSFDPEQTRSMMIHYFDLEGTAGTVPDKESAEKAIADAGAKLVEWNCTIQPGDDLEKVANGHSLMGRGFYIVETDGMDREDFNKIADTVKGLFVCS